MSDRVARKIEETLQLQRARRGRRGPIEEGEHRTADPFVSKIFEQDPATGLAPDQDVIVQPTDPVSEPVDTEEPVTPEEPKKEPGEEPDEDTEIEEKKRGLFNTLSELIDLGRIDRNEADIRAYVDQHQDEIGEMIDVLDDVLDMLIMEGKILRTPQTFEPESTPGQKDLGNNEMPGFGMQVPQGGTTTSVIAGDQSGNKGDHLVEKIIAGEDVDKVLASTIEQEGEPTPDEVGVMTEQWQDIAFVQGDEAQEVLDIIEDQGPEAALDHLADMGYMDLEGSGEPMYDQPWGEEDEVYHDEGTGLSLSWNPRLGYWGLARKIAGEQESARKKTPKARGKYGGEKPGKYVAESVTEQVNITRTGIAVQVAFADKAQAAAAKGALLQYKGIDTVIEGDENTVVVFTTDFDQEEARNRVETILMNARVPMESVQILKEAVVADVYHRGWGFEVNCKDEQEAAAAVQALKGDAKVDSAEIVMRGREGVVVEGLLDPAAIKTSGEAERWLKEILKASGLAESIEVYEAYEPLAMTYGDKGPDLLPTPVPVGHGQSGADLEDTAVTPDNPWGSDYPGEIGGDTSKEYKGFPIWRYYVDDVIEALPIDRATMNKLATAAPDAYERRVRLQMVWDKLDDEAKEAIAQAWAADTGNTLDENVTEQPIGQPEFGRCHICGKILRQQDAQRGRCSCGADISKDIRQPVAAESVNEQQPGLPVVTGDEEKYLQPFHATDSPEDQFPASAPSMDEPSGDDEPLDEPAATDVMWRMDVPEDPEELSHLEDVLNQAKDAGVIASWAHVPGEEPETALLPDEEPLSDVMSDEPPVEGGYKVLNGHDDMKPKTEQEPPPEPPPVADIEPGDVPVDELPPEETPPKDEEDGGPYIAVEFAAETEPEEREAFPDWVKSETGDPETGEGGIELSGWKVVPADETELDMEPAMDLDDVDGRLEPAGTTPEEEPVPASEERLLGKGVPEHVRNCYRAHLVAIERGDKEAADHFMGLVEYHVKRMKLDLNEVKEQFAHDPNKVGKHQVKHYTKDVKAPKIPWGEPKGPELTAEMKKLLTDYKAAVKGGDKSLAQRIRGELEFELKTAGIDPAQVIKEADEESLPPKDIPKDPFDHAYEVPVRQTTGGSETEEEVEERCSTPGRKIRSRGKGRGLGIGKGRGPIGRRASEK